MIKSLIQIVLVLVILGGAAILAKALVDSRQQPTKRVQPPVVPIVRALEVKPDAVRMVVHSQGTVAPRTETVLVAQVAGTVVAAAPALAAGGFFDAAEELLVVDPREYELALTSAAAEVAQRRVALQIEQAEAEVAIDQWRELGKGEPPALVRREPQLAQARAAVAAAEARLQRAELDVERCRIRTPYAGRVRQKLVDVGQYVTPGTALARVYAVDWAEVRLPIPDDELAYLELPLDRQDSGISAGAASHPAVTLRARFAGREHAWQGHIVRTEGEIDPRTRMVHAVARVERPYAPGDNGDAERPPLAAGMFVHAAIDGRTYDDVTVLPRAALRPGSERVLVIDDDQRLRHRDVDVLRLTRDHVYVRAGLTAGERVCLSVLEVVTDGMPVQVHDAVEDGR